MFESLRDEVLSGRIPPGTKMKLADYSERFAVSVAVVREALGRLAEQGLLQANPQRGFSTLPLSVDDLLGLTRARIIIETATLRESITHGDLAWEGSVLAAHHQLASTPRCDGSESGSECDGSEPGGRSINRAFAVAHRAFHVALLAGSGNSHLESIAASLRDRSELYLYWSFYLGDDTGRDVACEHRQLSELTIARDADNAVDALTRHIQRTSDSLAEYARRSGTA